MPDIEQNITDKITTNEVLQAVHEVVKLKLVELVDNLEADDPYLDGYAALAAGCSHGWCLAAYNPHGLLLAIKLGVLDAATKRGAQVAVQAREQMNTAEEVKTALDRIVDASRKK